MPSTVRALTRILAVHWSDSIQYRADIVLWTLSGILSPLLGMAVWYSVSQGSVSTPASAQVITYYLLLMLTSQFVMAWHGHFLANDILKGDIIKYLLRPTAVIWQSIANNIVEKSIRVPLLLIAVVAIYLWVPQVQAALPRHALPYLLFGVSLVLSTLITFVLETVLGVLAFWLEDVHELQRFKYLFETVASGLLVPYAFMPPLIATTLSLLPFRYMFATPVELLLGQLTGRAAGQALAIQGLWTVGLTVLLVILWRLGLKRYAVPGQ